MSAENYVGSKYREGRSIQDVVKAIRADIRAAQTRTGDDLWMLPRGLKVSIRREQFRSGKSSISLYVTACSGSVLNLASVLMREALPDELSPFPEHTKEFARVLAVLSALMNSYNFDKGDSQSDYFHLNFYGDASAPGDFHDECYAQMLASPEVTTLLPDVRVAIAGGELARARESIATMNTGYADRETEFRELAALFPRGHAP